MFNCTLRRGRPSRSTTQSSLTTLSTPRDPFQSSPSLTGITEEAFAEGEKVESLEDGIIPHDDRTLPLVHSAHVGLAIALDFTFCALLIRIVLSEFLLIGKNATMQLCIFAALPFLVRRFRLCCGLSLGCI